MHYKTDAGSRALFRFLSSASPRRYAITFYRILDKYARAAALAARRRALRTDQRRDAAVGQKEEA